MTILLGSLAAGLVADVSLTARLAAFRYWTIGAMGLFALAPPHVLLPDPHLELLPLYNFSPRHLLRHQLNRWLPVILTAILPLLLVAYYAPGSWPADLAVKSGLLAAHGLLAVGVGLYGYERFSLIGPRSQEWQEGRRGHVLRHMREETGQSLFIPDGMVPALTTTGRIFGVGLAGLVASAYLDRFGPQALAGLPGLGLLLWSAGRLVRRASRFDRWFYSTNALYSELFRSAGGRPASDRPPLPYSALYWVPTRWRPFVWASLLQFDRRLPLGRFMLLGLAFVAVLFYLNVEPRLITVVLVLLLIAKNAAVALPARVEFAPRAFQLTRQSAFDWAVTRWFVNIRWTLPVALTLFVIARLTDAFSSLHALAWTGLDLALGAALAAFVTLRTETASRRRYA